MLNNNEKDTIQAQNILHFRFLDYKHYTERSFKTHRGENYMAFNGSVIPIVHPDRVKMHCQKIGYQLLNPSSNDRNPIQFSKTIRAKMLRKVKLKCVKKKKQAYFRNLSPKKYINEINKLRYASQIPSGNMANRRSYNSNYHGRKLKGICKLQHEQKIQIVRIFVYDYINHFFKFYTKFQNLPIQKLKFSIYFQSNF